MCKICDDQARYDNSDPPEYIADNTLNLIARLRHERDAARFRMTQASVLRDVVIFARDPDEWTVGVQIEILCSRLSEAIEALEQRVSSQAPAAPDLQGKGITMADDLDLCDCGDYRRDHIDGAGACKLNYAHIEGTPCQAFRLNESSNDALVRLLHLAQEHVCNDACPSVWDTVKGQPHSSICREITAALDALSATAPADDVSGQGET